MMDITKSSLLEYAQKYNLRYAGTADEQIEIGLKKWLKVHKYLDKDKFVKLGKWKSPRQIKSYKRNDNKFVKEITRISFNARNEKARITILLSLHGVSWPVASVLLHFTFPNKYPIMDFRAIWSLGLNQPNNYTFEFWEKYCKTIRQLSRKFGLSIRTIDKALWMYSKIHQKS